MLPTDSHKLSRMLIFHMAVLLVKQAFSAPWQQVVSTESPRVDSSLEYTYPFSNAIRLRYCPKGTSLMHQAKSRILIIVHFF
ncbi:hypothetical protein EV361DRAFT_932963 [Lentinula raphanica]|uniref:Secreted protein n=1 Tax=Lentinula raphanica TaxID=153919 RepID=A0AA38P2G6_9AGAR|nr:hypothetical protein FB446DRAFT_739013 [Lentinula raphanica]KAJ3835059.1 hypothetical protein F5878DRAFT_628956 [Lentinula raphanica]KAJ3966969.1 hypothetical protein EV361DRAFT_932963 [Lentinula raphanica]